ncbi:MAG: class I mannose-6-phosphate isomerase [Planctomycetia bacterium]|nr:class I mannose-6-phosphate isomerase [Planctomycetia bacterium]
MMHPLLLTPVYRRYLWGGRRFATALGRELPPGDDFAESWEVVDRGADQSLVAAGPLAGRSLGDLVRNHGRELLGGHAPLPAFPLLFKFLDASRDLSVQVHPDDERAARAVPPDRGKTEAWYVIDAVPGSRIYAGLVEGVGRDELAAAIRAGTCASVLHAFEPQSGDCVFIPAGTVHAIGAGLLVAEIQQSSDITYRLFDWNRTGPDGRPRPLHVEAGVEAVTRFGPVRPVAPLLTADPAVHRLVTSDFFLFDEVRVSGTWAVGGDDACHVLAVLDGTLLLEDRWSLPPVGRGRTLILPASIGRQGMRPLDGGPVRMLHVALPTVTATR